jgi:hypothetical protein
LTAIGPRRWAVVGLTAQVVFVLAWLLAGIWQGPGYHGVRHSISDMYAVTAPHGWFLVVVLTLTGAGTISFALLGVRKALQPAGWRATVGAALLAASILGLGDLLSPWEREACRLADPGCTQASQLANSGGQLDGLLSSIGLVLLVAAGFFLAAAMRRLSRWRAWVRPVRGASLLLIVLILATVLVPDVGGLLERLLAAAGAAGVAALAVGVRRRPAPDATTVDKL